jgi:DNA helicase HerA-like ATPase
MTSIKFDDPTGWDARLRQQSLITRQARSRGNDIVVTGAVAIVDARFHIGILDQLSEPKFLAVERQTENGVTHLIYESVVPKPTHYQELGMNAATPTIIRREMLQTIDSSWGKSDESWIDILAIPMYHRLDGIDDAEPAFSRTKLNPLAGARVHLLSDRLVDRFINIRDGTEIGQIMGANQPLKVDMKNLIRYHSGSFGATGAGKSNFTSQLIRKGLDLEHDIRVVIFDLAGEYFVHLADKFRDTGNIYSTEMFRTPKQFLESQVVPETLEAKLPNQRIFEIADKALREERIKPISIRPEAGMTIEDIREMLENVGQRAGAFLAKTINEQIGNLIVEYKLKSDALLKSLEQTTLQKLKTIISSGEINAPERSGLKGELTTLKNYLDAMDIEEQDRPISAADLARTVLDSQGGAIDLVYVPNPYEARQIVTQFINTLLKLKKTAGKAAAKVLIILDEAQEYIPDRTKREDFTDQSNLAVEALLRQGRKYRAHCWLGTQRVAHLNVSALQQLHSYFVNVLPRIWDRLTIADAYSVSLDLLDKTLELEAGEWLFVSYNAAKRKNVPIFVKTPNNEDTLIAALC